MIWITILGVWEPICLNGVQSHKECWNRGVVCNKSRKKQNISDLNRRRIDIPEKSHKVCLLCCVVRHKRVFHSKVFGWTQELFEACQQSAVGRNGAQWCIAHQGPSGIMDEIMPERGLVLQILYCNNFVTRNRLEAHIFLMRLWHLLYIYVTYLKKNFLSQHHQTLYIVWKVISKQDWNTALRLFIFILPDWQMGDGLCFDRSMGKK